MKHTSNSPGRLLILLVGFALLSFLLISLIGGAMAAADIDIRAPHILQMTQGLSQLMVFLVPSLIVAKQGQGKIAERWCLDMRRRKWLLGLVGIVIVMLVMPSIDALNQWNEGWHCQSAPWKGWEEMLRRTATANKEVTALMLSQTGAGNLIFNLLIAALLPAICEEVFFRGTLQQLLQRVTGNIHAGVAIGATIFSLLHGDLFAFVPRFAMGLLLGYLFYYSGSLVVAILAHLFNNATIVIATYLHQTGTLAIDPTEPLNMPIIIVLCCLLASLALFSIYFVASKKTTQNTNKQ